jgi:HEAT repeat protein
MGLRSIGALLVAALASLGLAGCSDAGSQAADADGRLLAIHQLAAEGSEAAVDRLAQASHDADATVAVEAAWMLGRVQHDKADTVLAQVAATEPRVELRQAAVQSIIQRGRPQGAEALRLAVRSDPSPAVRGEAAAGLGRLGARPDALVLVAAAGAEHEAAVVVRAIAAAEQLLGVRLAYDPRAPEADRREALARLAALTPSLVRRDPVWRCADTEAAP